MGGEKDSLYGRPELGPPVTATLHLDGLRGHVFHILEPMLDQQAEACRDAVKKAIERYDLEGAVADIVYRKMHATLEASLGRMVEDAVERATRSGKWNLQQDIERRVEAAMEGLGNADNQ